MGNYDFKSDLSETQKKEIDFAEKLNKHYGAVRVGEFGKDNKWDMVFVSLKDGRSNISFEMKSDSMAKNTGNIAIEFHCRGKPSGISTSKADYYVYQIERGKVSDYYLIGVLELKRIIAEKLYFRKVSGGDKGSNTRMYLFKLKVFAKHATLLKFH